jgi:hypothetical protein
MKSQISLPLKSEHSQPTKHSTSWASVPLTKSEIESLKQGKRFISAYVQKEFATVVQPKLDQLKKPAA